MAIVERHWENLSEEKWERLATEWLRCIRDDSGQDMDSPDCEKWWQIVTNLGMFGAPEFLWKFLRLALSMAESDEELGSIAAGPIEYLLGRNGNEYIELVEQEAKTNQNLVRSIKKCNKYLMSDKVWTRVKEIQSR